MWLRHSVPGVTMMPTLRELTWLGLGTFAVGLPMWVFFGPGPSTVAMVVCAVATAATWLSFAPDRRFQRELSSREPLSDEQFFSQFYAGTSVDADIPRR